MHYDLEQHNSIHVSAGSCLETCPRGEIMWFRDILLAFAVVAAATPVGQANAQIRAGQDGLTARAGPVILRGRFAIGAQGAAFQPTGIRNTTLDGEIDGTVRLTAEVRTRQGVLFGVQTEIDTGNQDIEDFERDELFGYVVTEYGRLEIGENDGVADTLAEHAPTIGLGQVRGDFARYTGSIALLSPFDSRDAFKVSYFAPPVAGVSVGVTYAPRFSANPGARDPEDRTLQRNVVELGARYVRPVGGWVLAASGTWVRGDAAPETQRADISSWSVGTSASRGNWTLGAAYVARGRSNLRLTADKESEVNAGAAWRKGKWQAAGSYAVTIERGERSHRLGLGAERSIGRNLYIRSDVVGLRDRNRGNRGESGFVALSEIGLRF